MKYRDDKFIKFQSLQRSGDLESILYKRNKVSLQKKMYNKYLRSIICKSLWRSFNYLERDRIIDDYNYNGSKFIREKYKENQREFLLNELLS